MTLKTFAATALAFACSLAALQTATAANLSVAKPGTMTVQPVPHLRLAPLHVKCAAAGAPDFVHYGLLTNDGPRAIPEGSRVHWVMANGHSGYYKFASILPRRKAAEFDLHFYTSARNPCTAKFVK